MAQLLSPVCTETLRFQNLTGAIHPISPSICRVFSRTIGCWNPPCSGHGRGGFPRVMAATAGVSPTSSDALGQAKIRMMKQKGSDEINIFWNNLCGRSKEYRTSEEEGKERARRAAAARRWREYSRRGVDKPPTFKLARRSDFLY